MHDKLKTLKPLLKAGEYDKAADILKEYRTEFPYDWDGKLMEGIIAQLRGDEETFRRIHDEAQAVIDGHGKDAAQIQLSPLWKKYCSTWEKVAKVAVIGLLVGGGLVGGAIILYSAFRDSFNTMARAITGPGTSRQPEYTRQLYGGPEYFPDHLIQKDIIEIHKAIETYKKVTGEE